MFGDKQEKCLPLKRLPPHLCKQDRVQGKLSTREDYTQPREQQRKESSVCGVTLIIPETSFFFLMFSRLFFLSLSLLNHTGKLVSDRS